MRYYRSTYRVSPRKKIIITINIYTSREKNNLVFFLFFFIRIASVARCHFVLNRPYCMGARCSDPNVYIYCTNIRRIIMILFFFSSLYTDYYWMIRGGEGKRASDLYRYESRWTRRIIRNIRRIDCNISILTWPAGAFAPNLTTPFCQF